MMEDHDIVICGHCLYSYKRLIKSIDKGIIINDDIISEPDQFILFYLNIFNQNIFKLFNQNQHVDYLSCTL